MALSDAEFFAVLLCVQPRPLLWSRPRLLITPHVGGFGGLTSRDRLAAAVSDTVDRLLTGQPLKHVAWLLPSA